MIFTNQVKQNPKTKAKFAPGRDADGSYKVYKLCSNYDGKVRGGMRHSWGLVAKGLTIDEAKALLEKRCGMTLYNVKLESEID